MLPPVSLAESGGYSVGASSRDGDEALVGNRATAPPGPGLVAVSIPPLFAGLARLDLRKPATISG